MKELVVISGKGGTGKTSLVAAFAALAGQSVLADCDVDAANLHLVLDPKATHRESFSGGSRACIISHECTGCGRCADVCRFDAIKGVPDPGEAMTPSYEVDAMACEGCGVCARVCPADAIEFGPVPTGEWLVSDTRFGPMVHARLEAGGGNSGKLVALTRTKAREIARRKDIDLLISDGPPGVGCAVIASIAGADLVLIVSEPSLSAKHDLLRACDLAAFFGIPAAVCVNKWDLNPDVTRLIEEEATTRGLGVAGRIRYDAAVTEAQIARTNTIDYCESPVTEDIGNVWESARSALG